MGRRYIKSVLFTLFSFAFLLSYGQQAKMFETYSKLLSPEKLYLHIDKDTYCSGDTIWFKAYLKNSSIVAEFPESNYIYVELVSYKYEKDVFTGKTSENGRVVERIKVKRRNGELHGYIAIPEDVNSGKSILRAFTYWGLNFEPEYIFSRNVEILNPSKDKYNDELIALKVRERSRYTDAGLKYPFDKSKIKADFDCQFFAESGHLLSGFSNTIGVKAVGDNGLGIVVRGEVKDSNDNTITSFETDKYGFAKLRLTPSPDERYRAIVKDERDIEKTIELPKVEERGVSISLNRVGKNVMATLNLSGINRVQNLNFILFDASELFYNTQIAQSGNIAIPTDNLPVGIINAAITDDEGNVYATRPFIVLPEENQSSLILDKEKYGIRDRVVLSIDIKNSQGERTGGNFSLAITDDGYAPYRGKENNIVSYMLMQSELKGYIEDPQRFFDTKRPLKQREEEADMLLLTQGWRYYDIEKIIKGDNKMPTFGKEYIQTISGRVVARKNRPSYVSFLAPSINFSALGQLDSTGYFELMDINFPDSTLFIVNAVGTGIRGKRQFIPYIDEDNFAPMLNYFRNNGDTLANNTSLKTNLLDKIYSDGTGAMYQLDPVYIRSNRRYSKNDPAPLGGFRAYRPDQLREGAQLEPYKNYDLMTYVYETCQGLRMDIDSTSGEKILKCKVPRVSSEFHISDGWDEIVVYVNGIQAFSSSELGNYMVDDLVSLLYLRGTEASMYIPSQDGSPSVRSAVMIKTKINSKTGLPRNVAKGYPLGWQRAKLHYNPVYTYSNPSPPSGSDKRSTIYWEPNIMVGKERGIRLQFYTSDSSSDYTIVLEGVTDDGEYIYIRQPLKRK